VRSLSDAQQRMGVSEQRSEQDEQALLASSRAAA
jgi:hypothetical protein